MHALTGDTIAAHQLLELGEQRVGMIPLLVALARMTHTLPLVRIFPDEYGEAMKRRSQDAMGADIGDYLMAKVTPYYANPDLARGYYDSMVVWTTARIEANQCADVWRLVRVWALAGSGQKDVALREADAALMSGVPQPWMQILLAEAYVMMDEYDDAVGWLEAAESHPVLLVTPSLLRIDPYWEPLRDHPRFQQLVAGEN